MSMWGTTRIPYSPQLHMGSVVKFEEKKCIIGAWETDLDTSEIWFVTPELYQRTIDIAKILNSIDYCSEFRVPKELHIHWQNEKNEEIKVYKCPNFGR